MSGLHSIVQGLRVGPEIDADARLTHDGGELRAEGRRPSSIFSRAWDCLTRSPAQIESNKATARAVIAALHEQYGSRVADMAARQLDAHVRLGRPLTGRRLACIVARTEDMRSRNVARNEVLLGPNVDTVMNNALRRAFGVGDWPACLADRRQAEQAVHTAIRADESFRRSDFTGSEEQLLRHCTNVAARTLEHTARQILMPATCVLMAQTGAADTVSTGNMGSHFGPLYGLQGEERMSLDRQCMFMGSVLDQVAAVSEHGPSAAECSVHLGLVEMLREMTPDGLPGQVKPLIDAMQRDSLALQHRLLEGTGLAKLDEAGLQQLFDINRDLGELEQTLGENGWGKVVVDVESHRGRLLQHVGELEELAAALPSAEPLLSGLLERATALSADFDDFAARLEQGARVGLSPEVVAQLHQAGIETDEALIDRLGAGDGFTAADLAWLSVRGLPLIDTLMRFSPEEVSLLRQHGADIALGLQYLERQVPIHPQTMVSQFAQGRIVGEPEKLSGGSVSTTWKIRFGDVTTACKAAERGMGDGAAAIGLGIRPADARMAVRNIATRLVDDLLGFGLVPQTEMATFNGTLGVAMAFAAGAPAMTSRERELRPEEVASYRNWAEMVEQGFLGQEDCDVLLQQANVSVVDGRYVGRQEAAVALDYDNPQLRRELVKLQLLDALTAQGDRHGGNYLARFSPDGGFVGLQAIDNDQAFGTRIVNPDDLRGAMLGREGGNRNFRGVAMPSVVDRDIKAVFDQLDARQLSASLSGLLPAPELEAMLLRLEAIRAHLGDPGKTTVLPDASNEAWSSEIASAALADPERSYVGRDLAIRGTVDVVVSYDEEVS